MSAENIKPKWSREISRFLPVKPQFILWGNVFDIYPIEMSDTVTTMPLIPYLRELLKSEGYSLVCMYEPIIGITLLHGATEDAKQVLGSTFEVDKPQEVSLEAAAETICAAVDSSAVSNAIILNFSSRLPDVCCPTQAKVFYYRLFRSAQTATPKLIKSKDSDAENVGSQQLFPKQNLVIWILDKENDLPAWYAIDNHRIKSLPIAKPDHIVREVIINSVSKSIPGYNDIDESERERNRKLFIDQTNTMFAGEIISIAQIARKEKLPFSQIGDAIKRYKLGIIESPWTKINTKEIANAENRLSANVMGQSNAVCHTADILKRSIYNLSGAQFSKYSQKPKGVLFFAGPTGVGKTELAKSITELIFGSPTSYIRFDMSEFGSEHANQRLIGAPPGYVGYDVGGELTNAVKQNPFSVILFDEIEKASPKILDMFLQILDDGRLTSGRGETVYFSESLIIFTSNLGIFEQLPDGTKVQRVNTGMNYRDMSEKIEEAIEDYFKYKINRPEILNRIGKNIVVFDFIRPDTARKIFDKMVGNILFRMKDSHKIELEFADGVEDYLFSEVSKDLSMGGRGIGNTLEEIFVNPLSRAFFDIETKSGDTIIIKSVTFDDVWKVQLKVKIF